MSAVFYFIRATSPWAAMGLPLSLVVAVCTIKKTKPEKQVDNLGTKEAKK